MLKRSVQKEAGPPQHTHISREIVQQFSHHRLLRVGTQQFVNGVAVVAPARHRHEHLHHHHHLPEHDTFGDIELTASTPEKADRRDDDVVTISAQYELIVDSSGAPTLVTNTPTASVTVADSMHHDMV